MRKKIKSATRSKPTPARESKETSPGGRSGLVPAGDTRLTANIRTELHRKVRHVAIDRGLTVGELLEELIEKHL